MIDDLILVGRFGRTHGVRGRIRLIASDSSLTEIKTPFLIHTKSPKNDEFSDFTVLAVVQKAPNHSLIHLAGIENPEKASELTGSEVYISRDLLPNLEADQFYLFQLNGLEVVDPDGKRLGFFVKEVMENPAHWIFVLSDASQEILVPFVEKYIGEINLEEQTLEVLDWEDWFAV